MKILPLLALAAPALLGCSELDKMFPARYPMVVSATIRNPAVTHHADDGIMVAKDGESKHRIVEYTDERVCFLSQIDGAPPQQAQSYELRLMGFRTGEEPVEQVPSIPSERVVLRDSGKRMIATTSGPSLLDVSVIETCFVKPGQVITPETTYMVLRLASLPTNRDRDGVWKLTR